jgi:Protein of unknown function (DUF4240)
LNRTPNIALAVALVATALVAAYALGSSRGSVQDRQVSATQERQVSETPDRQGSATPAGMDEAAFWQLMADTRSASDNDTGRQSELLEERLSRLPAQQIVDFGRIRHRLDQEAYSWEIWGAAYVIDDGCSDDCFRDFRAYLISLGRDPYEAAMRDPDSLAPVVQDAEEGDWENADNVAPDAYESATGEDFPADDSDLSGNPRGEAWDDEEQDALVQRYPALAARFR